MQQIKRIDGKNFYYMFLAGSKNLLLNYAYLNKINVFPVPDGDTGTNMSSTIQSIIDQVKPVKKLNKTLEDMVDAALDGARGNSGLIVAQFVQGLYNELQNETKVDAPTFAQAVSKAVDHTYSALVHPKEGTILTLFRKWSEVLLKLAYETDDFISLVQSSYRELEKALCDTKNQLSALTKAGVVDAGAQGFVFFVKGMLDFILAGGDLKDLVGTRQKILISEEEMDIPQDQITYRFCTEALITGINIEREKIREHLGPMGDSLVLAGNSNKLRVHIHTDTPQMVVKYLSEFAVVQNAKVDDMVFQTEIRDHRKSDVAILVDSSADIPDEVLWKYQIHLVPLKVQLDNNIFLDRITLLHDDFYAYLASDRPYPKTSLPSLKDIQNKMSYLATYYKAIIVINVSSGLSGTWQACKECGKKIQAQTGIPIEVCDTKTLAGAQGLLALRVAKALEGGLSFADITRLLPVWSQLSNVYAITKTIKYFVKGGRIGKVKGFFATLMGVVPVVTPDKDGKGSIFLKSVNQNKSIDRIVEVVRKKIKTQSLHSYCVEYTNIESKPIAEAIIPRLVEITGKQPAFFTQVTPVVGNHAGVGTVAIATLME